MKMTAVITKVVPPHHEYSTDPVNDSVAAMVTVSPGKTAPTAFSVPHGSYAKGDSVQVEFVNGRNTEKGFRIAT